MTGHPTIGSFFRNTVGNVWDTTFGDEKRRWLNVKAESRVPPARLQSLACQLRPWTPRSAPWKSKNGGFYCN